MFFLNVENNFLQIQIPQSTVSYHPKHDIHTDVLFGRLKKNGLDMSFFHYIPIHSVFYMNFQHHACYIEESTI